ncbi:MAG: DUF1173 family protein [Chloroflexota bacterium]
MLRDPFIKIGSAKQLRQSDIEQSQESRKRHLAACHRIKGAARCMCRDDGIPMGVGLRDQTYYLYTQYKNDRQRHAFDCPNRTTGAGKGGHTDSLPVVDVDEKGININLASPSYRAAPRQKEEDASPKDKKAGGRGVTRHGQLLSLLEVLCSQAEINVWRPWFIGKRRYSTVRSRLLASTEGMKVNGYPLKPLLYIPPHYVESQQAEIQREFDGFMARLSEDSQRRRFFGYIVGQLRMIEEVKRGSIALKLKHSRTNLWISQEKWSRHSTRWFGGLAAKDVQQDHPRLVIARVERIEGKNGPWLSLDDIAVMTLADDTSWIPVDSHHERRLALHLVEAERRFHKPLQVERVDGELLPDFVLEDREDRCHLEVLGMMSDPNYAARVMEKRDIYAADDQAVWWWDVEAMPDWPPLPCADRCG